MVVKLLSIVAVVTVLIAGTAGTVHYIAPDCCADFFSCPFSKDCPVCPAPEDSSAQAPSDSCCTLTEECCTTGAPCCETVKP